MRVNFNQVFYCILCNFNEVVTQKKIRHGAHFDVAKVDSIEQICVRPASSTTCFLLIKRSTNMDENLRKLMKYKMYLIVMQSCLKYKIYYENALISKVTFPD